MKISKKKLKFLIRDMLQERSYDGLYPTYQDAVGTQILLNPHGKNLESAFYTVITGAGELKSIPAYKVSDKKVFNWLTELVALVDPTGISGWPDLKKAFDEWNSDQKSKKKAAFLLLALMGVIPVIGGAAGKSIKTIKGFEKFDAIGLSYRKARRILQDIRENRIKLPIGKKGKETVDKMIDALDDYFLKPSMSFYGINPFTTPALATQRKLSKKFPQVDFSFLSKKYKFPQGMKDYDFQDLAKKLGASFKIDVKNKTKIEKAYRDLVSLNPDLKKLPANTLKEKTDIMWGAASGYTPRDIKYFNEIGKKGKPVATYTNNKFKKKLDVIHSKLNIGNEGLGFVPSPETIDKLYNIAKQIK